jgi:hypothetical protein
VVTDRTALPQIPDFLKFYDFWHDLGLFADKLEGQSATRSGKSW